MAVLARSIQAARPSVSARPAARRVAVRSAGPEAPQTPAPAAPAAPAVEPMMAAAAPAAAPAAPIPAPVKGAPSFGEVMAFAGPAPETINGRLCMLAFVSAIGAELSTHESVAAQFADAAPAIVFTAVLFTAASLVPIFKNADRDTSFGPFTPKVELINGQIAMLGFAGLLIVEAVKGASLL